MWGKSEEEVQREKEKRAQYARDLERQREQDRLRKDQEKKRIKELDKKEDEKLHLEDQKRKLTEKLEKEAASQEGEPNRTKTPDNMNSTKGSGSLPASPAPSTAPVPVSPVTPTPIPMPVEPLHQTRHIQINDQTFMLDLALKQAELSWTRTMDKITYELTNEIQKLTTQLKEAREQIDRTKEENNNIKQELASYKQETTLQDTQAVVKKHEKKIESLHRKLEASKQTTQSEDDMAHDVTKSLVAESKFIFPDNTTIQKVNHNKYTAQHNGDNVDKMYLRANEKLKVLSNIERAYDNNSLQTLLTQINQTNKM